MPSVSPPRCAIDWRPPGTAAPGFPSPAPWTLRRRCWRAAWPERGSRSMPTSSWTLRTREHGRPTAPQRCRDNRKRPSAMTGTAGTFVRNFPWELPLATESCGLLGVGAAEQSEQLRRNLDAASLSLAEQRRQEVALFLFFLLQRLDFPMQPLHLEVQRGGRIRRLLELAKQMLGDGLVVFVIQLVLEACPEIHRNRADLHLDEHLLLTIRHVDRHLDQKMEALIAVRLGMGDIILDLHDGEILLHLEHVVDQVNIGYKRAGDPQAGDILDLLLDRGQRELAVFAVDLVHDAFRRFHARLRMLDRIVIVEKLEFLLEDFDLRLHLVQGELVHHHETGNVVLQLLEWLQLRRVHGWLLARPLGPL
ncbi:hypothetical protein BN871_DW_00140 [Paenibacillus sp. P22]|nr:hypothetical protein BN871_DW_00140 [Paenibacillus sp. P22]